MQKRWTDETSHLPLMRKHAECERETAASTFNMFYFAINFRVNFSYICTYLSIYTCLYIDLISVAMVVVF